MLTRRHFLTACAAPALAQSPAPKVDGYHGIWFTLGQRSEFGDKYSGGLGTYTANHVPMAIYAPAVRKTFFVYGGARDGKRHLLAMAGYYDHRRHLVPRPTIVHDKNGVDDPHDNPSLTIDGDGFLWVFVSGRGRLRPGLLYRSRQPYSIDSFDLILQREFTYPQPRWLAGHGFLLLFTKYTNGRELYSSHSPDGRTWSPDQKYAGIGGHYQTSHQRGATILTAFNRHPGGNVDKRTDLYYLASTDFGHTWRNAQGQPVSTPLTTPGNPTLVHDYAADQRLVYIHDLDLDDHSRPVILYTTSADYRPSPANHRRWTVARFTGDTWTRTPVTTANHNYSTGSLLLESPTRWRIFGPTEPGPQPVGSGGEIAIYQSRDHGQSWTRERTVTRRSPRNHNYLRRVVNAHPAFYAFWADGNPDTFSESRLYFTNQKGDRLFQLPTQIPRDFAEPLRIA